jgi:regulator of sirC expression with transglutaminase-like and TPR domain
VLTRLQNNILTRARIAGDHSCAEGAALRRALLNPADGHFWLDVAAVREERGAVTGALEALERAKGIGPGAARAAQAARLRLRAKLN